MTDAQDLVKALRELHELMPEASAHGAAMLLVCAEVRALRRDLRNYHSADLTELVDAFRQPVPESPEPESPEPGLSGYCAVCGAVEGTVHHPSCSFYPARVEVVKQGS